jgi:chitin deacetylase
MVILEHVVSPGSVKAYMDIYPLIQASGWKSQSVIKLIGNGSPYQDSQNTTLASPSSQSSTSQSGASQQNNNANGSKLPTPTSSGSTTQSTSSSSNTNAGHAHVVTFTGSLAGVGLSFMLSYLL